MVDSMARLDAWLADDRHRHYQSSVGGGTDATATVMLADQRQPEHLIADSLDELHAFAASIGLRRSWFQNKRSGPHYDLTASKRAIAVVQGAIELENREFVAILRRIREVQP